MSFSEDVLAGKLRALNETQASIVGLSQWILFHHRQSRRVARTWDTALARAPPDRKLPLVYLANDVLQQARARRKTDLLDDFGGVLGKALEGAYKGVPSAVRPKIRRSVNVWKERRVLPSALLETILAGFDKVDSEKNGENSKNSGNAGNNRSQTNSPAAAGGASGNIHPLVEPLNSHYAKVVQHDKSLATTLAIFNRDYGALFGEDSNLQSPNIFLNQIQSLLRLYHGLQRAAETAVADRRLLVRELERLVSREKQQLEETGSFDKFSEKHGLQRKIDKMLETKQELEEMILEDAGGKAAGEALAPAYSPVGSPKEVPLEAQLQDSQHTNSASNGTYNSNDEDENVIPTYENSDSDSGSDGDSDNSGSDSEPTKRKRVKEDNKEVKENADAKESNKPKENTDIKDTDVKDAETKGTEAKDTEIKDAEIKNTEVKNTEVKDTEIKNTEVKDTEDGDEYDPGVADGPEPKRQKTSDESAADVLVAPVLGSSAVTDASKLLEALKHLPK